MHPAIRERILSLAPLCRRHQVRRLALFGSAATDTFDPGASDIDLVVEFEAVDLREYAGNYFALQEELETLFGSSVDLVEAAAIRNPYFRRSVEDSQVVVYDGV
jgi:hypothetical protein